MSLSQLSDLQNNKLLIHHLCDNATEEVQNLNWDVPNVTFANNPTFGSTIRKATSTVDFQTDVIFETGVLFHALRSIPVTPSTMVVSYEEAGGQGEVRAGALNGAGTGFDFGAGVIYSFEGLGQSIDRVNDTRIIMSTRGPILTQFFPRTRIFNLNGTVLTVVNEGDSVLGLYKTDKTDITMVSESGFVIGVVSSSTSGVPPIGHLELFANFIGSGGLIENNQSGPPLGIASGVANDRFALRIRKLDTDKFICIYEDGDIGKCRVGTVGIGNVITIGSEFRFANVASNVDIAILDETHCVLLYRDDTETDGIVRTATITGTDITYGTSGSIGNDKDHQSIREIDRRRFLVTTRDVDSVERAGNAILGYVREDNITIDLGNPVVYSSSATRNQGGVLDFNRGYVSFRDPSVDGVTSILMGQRLDNDSTPYGNNLNGNSTLAVASLMAWAAGSQGAIGIGYLNDSVDRLVGKLQTRNNAVFYNRDENNDLVVTLDFGSGIAEWFTGVNVADDDQEYIVSHFEFTGGNWNLKTSQNGSSFINQGDRSGTDFFGGSGEVIIGVTPVADCTVDEVALWADNTEFTNEDLDGLYQLILAFQSDAPLVVGPRDPVIVGQNQRFAARIGVHTGSIGQNIFFGQRGVLAPGGFSTISPSGLGVT